MKSKTCSTSHLSIVMASRSALLLAATLTTGTAVADEWPLLRTGMWELNRTIETPGKPGNPQNMQTMKCMNPSDDMKKQNEMLKKSGCTFTPPVRAGNTYTYSATCNIQGATGTSKSVLTVEDDSAYSISIESDFTGTSTHEVLHARRVADCRP